MWNDGCTCQWLWFTLIQPTQREARGDCCGCALTDKPTLSYANYRSCVTGRTDQELIILSMAWVLLSKHGPAVGLLPRYSNIHRRRIRRERYVCPAGGGGLFQIKAWYGEPEIRAVAFWWSLVRTTKGNGASPSYERTQLHHTVMYLRLNS